MACNCKRCGARLRVVSSYRSADAQVRYVVCTECRARGKTVVPATEIWRRKR